MPRILLIISTRNRIKARAYKQPKLPSERLWFSVTGLDSPLPVTAALSRSINPPAVIARPPVATLASSLSGRPAFIEVKPQLPKKRKREQTPAPPATTTSTNHDDDAASIHDLEDSAIDLSATVDPALLDPALLIEKGSPPALTVEEEPSPAPTVEEEPSPAPTFEEEPSPAPIAEEEDDLPVSPKRRRISLDLAPSSCLLLPPSERPVEAKFSPVQVVWATSMLQAVLDARALAGREYEGADCAWLVQAVRDGALEVEKDHFVDMGMDGQARDERMEEYDALLAKCLEKKEVVEEVLVEEIEIESESEESGEEEMSDADEIVEDVSEEEDVQDSLSSSDEEFSEEEEED
ncbi:hypothetical protein FKW77_007784 [Venturia effusa]|uniref:Uncharacterized protein n=1 Tax=Venturia effusa TaxID=50376 RepID=A0A517LM14_9PEZI|nr:hypothetical protein FKW77_007784 [Venturia effusa]